MYALFRTWYIRLCMLYSVHDASDYVCFIPYMPFSTTSAYLPYMPFLTLYIRHMSVYVCLIPYVSRVIAKVGYRIYDYLRPRSDCIDIQADQDFGCLLTRSLFIEELAGEKRRP